MTWSFSDKSSLTSDNRKERASPANYGYHTLERHCTVSAILMFLRSTFVHIIGARWSKRSYWRPPPTTIEICILLPAGHWCCRFATGATPCVRREQKRYVAE